MLLFVNKTFDLLQDGVIGRRFSHSHDLALTRPYARNFTNSVLTRSACVHRTPCGPPGSSTNLTFFTILACRLDVASGGRIRSASPCRMSVGTVFFGRSLRKSWCEQRTHATLASAEESAATFPLSSRARSITSFPPVTS